MRVQRVRAPRERDVDGAVPPVVGVVVAAAAAWRRQLKSHLERGAAEVEHAERRGVRPVGAVAGVAAAATARAQAAGQKVDGDPAVRRLLGAADDARPLGPRQKAGARDDGARPVQQIAAAALRQAPRAARRHEQQRRPCALAARHDGARPIEQRRERLLGAAAARGELVEPRLRLDALGQAGDDCVIVWRRGIVVRVECKEEL